MDGSNLLTPQSQDPIAAFQSPPPSLAHAAFAESLEHKVAGSPPPPVQPHTTPKPNKKRKLSTVIDHDQRLSLSDNGFDDEDTDLQRNGSSRKARSAGTKRACNQCRQQKLKCNVIESPWKDCDRCRKHELRCEITADFKRVGKRSQQAELERNNEMLARRNEELTRLLASYREQAPVEPYRGFIRRQVDESTPFSEPAGTPRDESSHDAVLLLNLKQGHESAPANRASPMGRTKQLGDVTLFGELLTRLWDEYFDKYHLFLRILDKEHDTPDSVFERSEILFWTVIVIAARHFEEDRTLFGRLAPHYNILVKEMIVRPPSNHYVVKALCLLCTWPLPVSSTTADMSFPFSGIMMKFAMQLGLHRPSHPMDFSRTRVQLRAEDITDRLRTWAACNLVAQNVSTGYGQPPDTVYDATLNAPLDGSAEQYRVFNYLHTRLEIEKFVNRITQEVYSPQQHPQSMVEEPSIQLKASMLAPTIQQLESTVDLNDHIDRLYFHAAQLHLRLHVFFDDPSSPRYQLDLEELYLAAKATIVCALNCPVDLRYAPNYVMQIMIAAAVALLKLLNSTFGFAEHVDREVGEGLFGDGITAIRQMSVKTNDLPQRLAEVFAQMWKADAERIDSGQGPDSRPPGEPDASLTLKRRYRMSMSHVFDSIWRWKDELQGKVRTEKLDTAVKNPTSPVATHRGSFSNGRRPSSSLTGDPNELGMTSFGGFGMPLSGDSDMAYATSYDFFDPMGWYLNGFGGTTTGLDSWP
ncbi:hypothetical protein EJ06DRAFT_190002 [Trichodelitschia bisporula]|uniref:Zn(2)-C6 fungal-type domain-containing protein n=1 Tax=Trichodelitschia bisporula TaxID=703511 RepID=A0A6G1I790_9PEZI|nr:hypothetical protein EJ06DRAFT_190002 [Trichodelitschia bisporula]